ncbi:RHS repeat-associated core domain-containing protein [Pseudomonas putida]|uniref:RHS repeat-associated core domain-containing protein n=1 Tax=Pseudomonas putida TaxID=303 RepID=UPI003D96CF6D
MPNLPSASQTRTILLAPDDKNSIHAELAGGQRNSIAYALYGYRSAQQEIAAHLGFNGELCERIFGWYLLGKGYRAYNPILMRFHSPDSWSPFGKGGFNAYAYCGGDPRNLTDPTGHMFRMPKLFGKLGNESVTRTTSTSSLSPLISNAAEMASTAPPEATSKTIPALTRESLTETIVSERNFIDYGPSRKTPLPIPSKQLPRVNDTGGQVHINDNEVWRSQPFKFPPAPLPPRRALKGGGTREYSVRYDDAGNPTQTSVEKMNMKQIVRSIRKTMKS